MDLEAQQFNPYVPRSAIGKPSIISSYFVDAQREEGTAGVISCVWICFEERGRICAKDIKINSDATKVCIHEIARNCSWWRRVSMFSVVDVKEAEVSVGL